jgi:hypothetical protein
MVGSQYQHSVTECNECGERKAKQKKTDMRRIKKDTSVINAVPEEKQSLVGRTFWNLRNIKKGRDK